MRIERFRILRNRFEKEEISGKELREIFAALERLRTVLYRIGYDPIGDPEAGVQEIYDEIVKIAREAVDSRDEVSPAGPDMSLEEAKAIARAAAVRFMSATPEQVLTDPWTCAILTIVNREVARMVETTGNSAAETVVRRVQSLKQWPAVRFMAGLLQATRQDERKKIAEAVKATEPEEAPGGIMYSPELDLTRKADPCICSRIDVTPGPDGEGVEIHRPNCPQYVAPEPEKPRTIEQIRSGPQTYDALKAVVAQRAYCAEKSFPNFAGGGICFSCNRSVYERQKTKHVDSHFVTEGGAMIPDGPEVERETGISVEEAAETLVTGCPHCHRTFCD